MAASTVNRVRFEGDLSPQKEGGVKYNADIPEDAMESFIGQVENDSPKRQVKTDDGILASQDSAASISSTNRLRVFKIIVIGDSGVGKTCLTFRFCGGEFREDAEVTIGVDFRERILEVEAEKIKIQLWDTAGQERFRRSMVQHYYRNAHAVVFVYDVTKMSSFESLPEWIAECNKFSLGVNVPRILVGNKCDCRSSQAVPTNLAQKYADYHNMPLFETSAKDDSEVNHVEAIFVTLALKLKRERPFLPLLNSETCNEASISLHMTEKHSPNDSESSCLC